MSLAGCSHLLAVLVVSTVGCGGGDSTGSGTVGADRNTTAVGVAKKLRLVSIGKFDQPLYLTAPTGEGSRLFVVEKGGRIRVVSNGKKLAESFLSVRGRISTGSEQGLLSMAFAPDYSSSGKFYINFTDRDGNTRIEEYRRSASDPNRADKSTRRGLFEIDQPFENHNGGQLQFGPDGLLYIGMGDGGSGGDPNNNAQSLDTLLGKLLRVDPQPGSGRPYSIPEGNPSRERSGARDEIYALGLRNPWRFSFDANGGIWIADVGQNEFEEIDHLGKNSARGENFGWSRYEGFKLFRDEISAADVVKPVKVHTHASGNCSVTGGYVVQDSSLGNLVGSYVYGDFCKGDLLSLRLRDGKAKVRQVGLHVDALSSFGEDGQRRLYATSLNGPVYRLALR